MGPTATHNYRFLVRGTKAVSCQLPLPKPSLLVVTTTQHDAINYAIQSTYLRECNHQPPLSVTSLLHVFHRRCGPILNFVCSKFCIPLGGNEPHPFTFPLLANPPCNLRVVCVKASPYNCFSLFMTRLRKLWLKAHHNGGFRPPSEGTIWTGLIGSSGTS